MTRLRSKNFRKRCSPEQTRPGREMDPERSWNPSLHLHVYDPSVLMQSDCEEQSLWSESLHSSKSPIVTRFTWG